MARLAQPPEQYAGTRHVSVDLIQTPLPSGVLGTVATDVQAVSADDADPRAGDLFPKPGDEFFGFELVDELGRGAFGRVFLARERQLSNRPVVLKVTLKANNEQHRLARLQHTNIVPIQNAFRRGPYHVVQMPYFGRQTLADVISHVRTDSTFPQVGGDVFTTAAQASTHRNTKHHSSKVDSGVQPFAAPPVETDAPAAEITDVHPLRDLLTGMPYTDAVLAVLRRLADGLAHAHHRGILHLDLKPANVLFSDDGQPMLLDFNLSADRTSDDRKRVGGTWPYMAPETIRAFAGLSDEPADERTDLYALGVIFFELLTCRLPFATIRRVPEDLPAAIAEREQGAPAVRDFNPDVPHAVEAVVRKLLAPNPADRYQTVDQLRQDLQRQQENLPLLYAADRNLVERVQKWKKRNPNLMGRLAGVLAAATVVMGGVWAMSVRRDRAVNESLTTAAGLKAALVTARVDLSSPADATARDTGTQTLTGWLAKFDAGAHANWTTGDRLRNLDDARRAGVLGDLGEAALLLAHAAAVDGREADAVKWNRVAQESFTPAVPASVWLQRRELASRFGRDDLRASVPAELPTVRTDVDQFWQAAADIRDGKSNAAAAALAALTERQPQHFAGHLLLAMTYQSLGKSYQALERFRIAKPLAPTDPRAAYHAGLLLTRWAKYDEAEAEFTQALAVAPRHVPALHRRGIARLKRDKAAAAIEDFSLALNSGGATVGLYLDRADAYDRYGSPAEAERDRTEAGKLEPVSVEDLTARALRDCGGDPAKALAYFDRAIAANPRHVPSYHNKAWFLSEKLGDHAKAVDVFDEALTVAPGYGPSLATKALYLARLGNHRAADVEAKKALLSSADPEVSYQVAGVYSLTSRSVPGDADQAVLYFTQSLRDGFRDFMAVDADPDLKWVRDRPDFQAVLAAARTAGGR